MFPGRRSSARSFQLADPHPDEPHRAVEGQPLQACECGATDGLRRVGRPGKRVLARVRVEAGKTDLDADAPPAIALGAQLVRDLARLPGDRAPDRLDVARVLLERGLAAAALRLPVRDELALVDAARRLVEEGGARRAELADQPLDRQSGKLSDSSIPASSSTGDTDRSAALTFSETAAYA